MAEVPTSQGEGAAQGGPNPSKGKGRGPKEPWVVQQARREVEAAKSAIESATNDITKKQAKADLERAQERLKGLLEAEKREQRIRARREQAERDLAAAKKTADPKDDVEAQAELDRLKRRTEVAGERKEEARSDARDYFFSQMGPMIAEAIKEFPQLREFFRRAIAEGWTEPKQERELNNPDNPWFEWWDSRGKWWRAGFAKQYRSGATTGTWGDDIAESRDIIRAAAAKAGVVLTAEQENNLARRYWYSNWQADPAALESWMQQRAAAQRTPGTGTGDEGTGATPADPLLPANRNKKISELADLAEAYGLELDEKALGDWADLILDPKKNTDGIQDTRFVEYLVQTARSKYVTFGDQIDADTNLRQLAGGYVSELARLLELDPAEIRFTPTGMDPLLQKALTNIDPETGKPSRIPLWEFTKQIRQDDRWQFTDNARDSYMGAASKFARALGLAG